jgi:hypothetical protein
MPDITVLLTLNERERVRRLRHRAVFTAADAETLEPDFRATVLDHLHGVCDLQVDVSGLKPQAAARRVWSAVVAWPRLATTLDVARTRTGVREPGNHPIRVQVRDGPV